MLNPSSLIFNSSLFTSFKKNIRLSVDLSEGPTKGDNLGGEEKQVNPKYSNQQAEHPTMIQWQIKQNMTLYTYILLTMTLNAYILLAMKLYAYILLTMTKKKQADRKMDFGTD